VVTDRTGDEHNPDACADDVGADVCTAIGAAYLGAVDEWSVVGAVLVYLTDQGVRGARLHAGSVAAAGAAAEALLRALLGVEPAGPDPAGPDVAAWTHLHPRTPDRGGS